MLPLCGSLCALVNAKAEGSIALPSAFLPLSGPYGTVISL